jgi:uncharacterized protein YchJ
MNPSLLNPFTYTMTRTTSLLLIGLALTASAIAQQAPAPLAAASAPPTTVTPQWAPEQVAKPKLPPMTTPEQIAVRDRATARWQALVAGDYAKSYAFVAPSIQKNKTEADYLKQFEKKPQWYGAEVLTATCATPAKCVARVRIDSKISLPRVNLNKITTHGDETWLFEDGQWWYFDDTAQ